MRHQHATRSTRLLVAILVLVAVGLFLLFSPPMLLHRAHAAELPAATAGPLRLQAERTTSGARERARLEISGRTPARLADGAAVTVRVLATAASARCPAPRVDGRGRLTAPAGSERVGWQSLSALRPGTRLGAGRAFAMVGTVALPTERVRLCGYLVRTGSDPTVLRRGSQLVDRRIGAFLDPVVGRSLAATLDPVVRFLVPALMVLVAGLGALLLRGLRRRRLRRERAARRTSAPHRRSAPPVRTRPAAHLPSPVERSVALPPLPSGVVVPDVPPASLTGPPPVVAPVEVAVARPLPGTTPPSRRRRFRRGRERQATLQRALEPLVPVVDGILGLGGAYGDAALVIARDERLAFVVLLATDAGDDLDLARLAAVATRVRDERLGGLAPIPVLVSREGIGAATVHPPHPGYPGLDVWRVNLGELARFLLARVPSGRPSRARAGREG
ncbi:hypothetical protein [Patulibacter defluvii]|uniref:hypothetical protein n=1 Tax=Patulibacter defluvii TaxID=3095358 RepID=UPI002A7480F3|nr:hypothetical protein [Patulibacter sp. DM4]